MARIAFSAALAVSVAAAIAAPLSAAQVQADSWGKAGISFAQYRQDSIDCASAGYYRDISQTDDAKAFVAASKQLDAVTSSSSVPSADTSSGPGAENAAIMDQALQSANQQQRIIEGIHPQERMKNIGQLLQSTIEQCLAKRGYSKFRLTGEQRHILGKLKAGSDERRHYLFSLASDPTVLDSQREDSQP